MSLTPTPPSKIDAYVKAHAAYRAVPEAHLKEIASLDLRDAANQAWSKLSEQEKRVAIKRLWDTLSPREKQTIQQWALDHL